HAARRLRGNALTQTAPRAAGRLLGMSTDDQQMPDPDEVPAGAEPAPGTPVSVRAERGARMTPAEAVRDMRINVPARANRILREVIDRVNRDDSIKALWHAANVNAVARMQINDHSWVHI